MKALHYLLTWLCLLFTLPIALLATVYGLAIGGKPDLVFNWKAFWEFVKKGDFFT